MSRFRLLFLLAAVVVSMIPAARPAHAGFGNGQSCSYDDQCPRNFHCCSCQCVIGICDPFDVCS
jgi:hypothetical protein